MFASPLHGTMANGMPSSIGLQMAEPGRHVVCMAGDGGISMLFGDVMTVIQQKLPIKIAVYEGMLDTLTNLAIRTSPALRERWIFGTDCFECERIGDRGQGLAGSAGTGASARARQPDAARHAAIYAGPAIGMALYSARAVLHGRGGDVLEMAKEKFL